MVLFEKVIHTIHYSNVELISIIQDRFLNNYNNFFKNLYGIQKRTSFDIPNILWYPRVAVFKKKSEVAKALALSPQVPPHPPFPC